MPRYVLDFAGVATGATADTYKTIAALIAADTLGHRARLRKLTITPASANPVDEVCSVQIKRIADVSGGTPGTKTAVAAASISKADPETIDSLVSGGINYTVEPTTYETRALWQASFNMRAGLLKTWNEDDGPMICRDQLLGLLAAPEDNSALDLNGSLEFECPV